MPDARYGYTVATEGPTLTLAIEAIRTSKKLSCRKATRTYNIPESTLRNRMAGRTLRNETLANGLNLTELEEQIIVNHILDRDSRGFSPRQADVEDMANWLRKTRRAKPVSKL
jgi:hypothetical protein